MNLVVGTTDAVAHFFVHLSNLPPKLVWGLLSRGLGVVYFVSFASLSTQIVAAAGRAGLMPPRFELMRRDFPTWKRFFYFPSLLWIHESDRFLGALPWIGMASAASIVFGGSHTPWAFFACWAVYLSLDRAIMLIYPWDCLLFEAGFWAMFLPVTNALPALTAASAPLPALAWVYRLLLFRVIFGFGKFKFLGTTRRDTGYLKGFYINQPLPSPIGWLSHRLPMRLLKIALGIMFLIEIVLPFTVFFPGPWSAFGAATIAALMVLIWLSGTFGYFNLVMIVLCAGWLDTQTARAFTFAGLFAWNASTFLHVLIILHTIGAVLSFPFNSFCANTWLLWSSWLRIRPRFLQWPVAFYRALHPLRWLHAFGVFPPRSVPGVKMVPVMEVSWDGEEWFTLQHRFSPTLETSRPKFCAPHHARLDQALIYEAFGLNDASVMRNLVGWWEPYGNSRVTGAAVLARRIVEGNVPSTVFYDKSLEQERGRPKMARVRTYMLEPTSVSEVLKTGRWWKRTLVGPHWPPMTLEDGYWENMIPPPELWHFDDLVWVRRSRMGAVMKRAVAGEDSHSLVLEGPDGFSTEERDRFWNDFLPTVLGKDRHDWTGLRKMVEHVRQKYGYATLYRFERLVGRYGLLLFAKLEPLFLDQGLKPAFGLATPTLDAKTYYHLALLARHILGEGREAYDAVTRDPVRAREHLARMTMQSGNYFQAIFRYEIMVWQAYKFRLLDNYLEHENRTRSDALTDARAVRIDGIARRLFGAVEVVEFLKTQFKGAEDVLDVPENWPRFELAASGEVRRLVQMREQPEGGALPAAS